MVRLLREGSGLRHALRDKGSPGDFWTASGRTKTMEIKNNVQAYDRFGFHNYSTVQVAHDGTVSEQ